MSPVWGRWLLVRRSVRAPTDRVAYGVCAPQTTTLEEAVPVAGARWTIESCFEATKGDVGLEHYEVWSWMEWYRHITLARWVYALLTVLRAAHVPAVALQKKG